MKYMIIHDIFVYRLFCLFSVRDMHSAFVVIDVQAFKYVSYTSTPRDAVGMWNTSILMQRFFFSSSCECKRYCNLELT